MKGQMTRSLAGFVPVAALVLLLTGVATAAGSKSIASAPVVSPGAAVSGNTASDPTIQPGAGDETGCWNDLEYWGVPLTVGDAVVIKGAAITPGYNIELGVFPDGTTDANIAMTDAVKTVLLSHVPLRFTATATGSYPIAVGPNCYDGVDGPFSFTVAVTHNSSGATAVVALPKLGRLAPSSVVTASVRTSSGAAITDPKLSLTLYGTWNGTRHVVARATPAGGSARFAVHVPAALKGTAIELQVTAPASDYKPVSSATLQVRIG